MSVPAARAQVDACGRPRRGGDRAVGRTAPRRRAAGAELREHPQPRHRVRSARRADDAADAAAANRYTGKAVNAFFNQLVERVSAIPGVRAVSAASQFPPLGAFATQFVLERGSSSGTTLPTALITVGDPAALRDVERPDARRPRLHG